MRCGIVFSDVDGTLVDSKKEVLPSSVQAVASLKKKGIPFVIVSARSPSGLYPIQKKLGVSCPLICYSGSLMLDEQRNVLWSIGFSKAVAKEVIGFVEEKGFDCKWNLYSGDRWIVADANHWMVRREANAVHATPEQGNADSLKENEPVGKILLICDPKQTSSIETSLKETFPNLSICCSSDILVEVMPKGVSKGEAVRKACAHYDIPLSDAVAFGDHYNDVEMLSAVGHPYLMGNAPEELKKRFPDVTEDNDHDGIANQLKRLECN